MDNYKSIFVQDTKLSGNPIHSLTCTVATLLLQVPHTSKSPLRDKNLTEVCEWKGQRRAKEEVRFYTDLVQSLSPTMRAVRSKDFPKVTQLISHKKEIESLHMRDSNNGTVESMTSR